MIHATLKEQTVRAWKDMDAWCIDIWTYRSEMKKTMQASKQMNEMLQPMYVM